MKLFKRVAFVVHFRSPLLSSSTVINNDTTSKSIRFILAFAAVDTQAQHSIMDRKFAQRLAVDHTVIDSVETVSFDGRKMNETLLSHPIVIEALFLQTDRIPIRFSHRTTNTIHHRF